MEVFALLILGLVTLLAPSSFCKDTPLETLTDTKSLRDLEYVITIAHDQSQRFSRKALKVLEDSQRDYPDTPFRQIVAKNNTETISELGIRKFPSISLFFYGQKLTFRGNPLSKKQLEKWIFKMIKKEPVDLTDIAFVGNEDISVVYSAEKDSELDKLMRFLAKTHKELAIFRAPIPLMNEFAQQKGAALEEGSQHLLVMRKADQSIGVYAGEPDYHKIEEFIAEIQHPSFGEFGASELPDIKDYSLDLFLRVYGSHEEQNADRDALKAFAEENKQYLVTRYAILGTGAKKHGGLSLLDIENVGDFILVNDDAERDQRGLFRCGGLKQLEKSETGSNNKCRDQYLNRNLRRYYKSQTEVLEQTSENVRHITGKEYTRLVLKDHKNDIIVLAYGSLTKKIYQSFADFASLLETGRPVKFMSIDIDKNAHSELRRVKQGTLLVYTPNSHTFAKMRLVEFDVDRVFDFLEDQLPRPTLKALQRYYDQNANSSGRDL